VDQSPIVVLIGPEGGLTVDEVEMAREYGFATVGLGPRVLRTETAAIVLTSVVRYSLGELEPQGERLFSPVSSSRKRQRCVQRSRAQGLLSRHDWCRKNG